MRRLGRDGVELCLTQRHHALIALSLALVALLLLARLALATLLLQVRALGAPLRLLLALPLPLQLLLRNKHGLLAGSEGALLSRHL